MFFKKLLSGMLVMVMLFGVTAFAGEGSAYITVSDLYYSDPERTIDLNGLSVNLKLSGNSGFAQLLLSLFTGTDEIRAAIEADNQAAYLYADGFTVPYAITFENLMLMLGELTGTPAQFNWLKPEIMFTEDVKEELIADEAIGIGSLIHEMYSEILGDASQIQNAKTATVSTFTHDFMSAFVVPMEIDRDTVDAKLLQAVRELDADEDMKALYTGVGQQGEATEGEAAVSLEEIYIQNIRPLNLSIEGNTYYGEDDIFVNVALCSDGVEIVPVFLEITNSENPVLYLNVPLQTENGEIIFYTTIEAASDRSSEYVELGVLNNGTTTALIVYQKGVSDDGLMPAYDFYAGFAAGTEVYELSAYYETDDKTARRIKCSANLSGIAMELLYNGNISLAGEESAEVGEIQLATNIGIQAKARLGFGAGAFDAVSMISQPGSLVVLSDMDDQQAVELSNNLALLTEKVMTALASGVPGFAALLEGAVPAEG